MHLPGRALCRYSREPCYFDWYQGYSGLAPLLARHFQPQEPLLQVQHLLPGNTYAPSPPYALHVGMRGCQ
jgi:hypothetical protein